MSGELALCDLQYHAHDILQWEAAAESAFLLISAITGASLTSPEVTHYAGQQAGDGEHPSGNPQTSLAGRCYPEVEG